ncbi:MAG: hypothetical protein U9N32_08995, partial [Spirochaetota bacterium]|nr:hypothetical protein [Spirochaetota bacterium]
LQSLAAKWSVEIKKKRSGFTDFTGFSIEALDRIINKLVTDGICSVSGSPGNIESITLLDFYHESIKKAFEEIELQPEISFPDEDSFGGTFPKDLITVIDVKTGFLDLLKSDNKESSRLLRINFSEGIRSIVVLSDILDPQLLQICVSKARLYLSIKRNYDYIFHRMQGLFQNKDQVIKEMFTKIIGQRNLAIATILNPDDFTFQFWSHFSSLIIKEFREKKDKLEREHGFSQSAYLLGFYNLYYKGTKQEKKDKELSFKQVEIGLRKSPYIFSFTDIMGFKDKSGFPLSRKIDRSELSEYLKKRTNPVEEQIIPDILKFNTSSDKYMFMNKEKYLSLTLRKIQEDSRELQSQYIDEWKDVLGDFKRLKMMNDRNLFIEDIAFRVRNMDPVLMMLMKFDYLVLCLEETKPPREVYVETERLFNRARDNFKSLDEIFRLDRKSLYNNAKSMLPIWKTLPVIGSLAHIFKRLFSGAKKGAAGIKDPSDLISGFHKPFPSQPVNRKKHKKSEEINAVEVFSGRKDKSGSSSSGETTKNKVKTSREQLAKYRKAVAKLKEHYVGEKGNLNEAISSSINIWNPLMDGKAKQDLIEDVNSMIRDYIRGMKKGFSV